MENTSTDKIISIHQAQKEYFRSGETLCVCFRKKMLKKLLEAMEKWESKLADALWTDLHKSYEEAYLTEISIVTGTNNRIGNMYSEFIKIIFLKCKTINYSTVFNGGIRSSSAT